MDVVLGAGQLGDLVVSPLQISDLVGQTLHVALCVVQRRPLVGGDQLGHLLLHPLDGAHHVAEHLLALLQSSLGRVLPRGHGRDGVNEQGVTLSTLSSLPVKGMCVSMCVLQWVFLYLERVDSLFKLLHLFESVMNLLLDLSLGGAQTLL